MKPLKLAQAVVGAGREEGVVSAANFNHVGEMAGAAVDNRALIVVYSRLRIRSGLASARASPSRLAGSPM